MAAVAVAATFVVIGTRDSHKHVATHVAVSGVRESVVYAPRAQRTHTSAPFHLCPFPPSPPPSPYKLQNKTQAKTAAAVAHLLRGGVQSASVVVCGLWQVAAAVAAAAVAGAPFGCHCHDRLERTHPLEMAALSIVCT